MANVNVNLTGMLLQAYDLAANLYRVNSPEATLTLPATAVSYEAYLPVTGTQALTLPGTTVWFLWIRNLAAAGNGNLTIQKQVTGGALVSAANSEVLAPGGVYLFANPTELANGIVAVTLTATQTLPIEFLAAF